MQNKEIKNNYCYLIIGTLYRRYKDSEKLIEINKIFSDTNPINARKEAFTYFQNYIDVLLESRDYESSSYNDLDKILHPFLSADNNEKLLEKSKINHEILIDYDFDKGIHLYFVDESKKQILNNGTIYYPNKYLIHSMSKHDKYTVEHIINNLIKELNIYKNSQPKYSTKDITIWKKRNNIETLYTPLSS